MADTVEGLVKRDIYEVANQLQGFVGPNTDEKLAAWLIREGDEAAKLADEIVRLRAQVEALLVERDEARDERDQLIAWFDGLTPLEMDDSIRTLVNRAEAAESRALAAEAERDKAIEALKAIAEEADLALDDGGFGVHRSDIQEISRHARSTLDEIAP